MKKGTFILFIMFANIIILAHGVVPHHHFPHNSSFLTSETVEAENKHHHPESSNSEHNHDHDSESDNEHCLLNQVVGIPINSARQLCGCIFHLDIHPNLGGFNAVLLFLQDECEAKDASIRLRPPLLAFSYISYASSVLGLRAPPTA